MLLYKWHTSLWPSTSAADLQVLFLTSCIPNYSSCNLHEQAAQVRLLEQEVARLEHELEGPGE